MQDQTSDFFQKFLLEFTKQLIENSKPKGIIEVEQKEKIPEPKEFKDLEELKNIPKKKKIISIEKSNIQQSPRELQKPVNKQQIQRLTIPEQKLPPQFQHINPVPTEKEINLGKLNPILKDQMANSIECDGPNVPIIVITKTGQKRKTQVVLTKEEIDTIINTFSTETRIPALEGVYKVAAGNLIFLAVISEVIGSKFVIRKIPPQQSANRQMQRGFGNRPPQRMIRR